MNFIKNIINSKTGLFIGLGIFALIIVLILDLFDPKFSKHDILVEFHGLVFDLFVFGIVLTIYETQKARKEKKKTEEKRRVELIERYTEEINDYKFWKSEESLYRTRGLIERLVKLGATELNLSHCYLSTNNSLMFKDMKNWKFSGAQMNDCAFALSDMTNAEFYHSVLIDSHFNQVNLTNTKFNSSILMNAKFEKCNFENSELDRAIVSSKKWFDNLEKNENIGIKPLMEKYEVEKKPEIINEVEIYRIKRKKTYT